MEAVHR